MADIVLTGDTSGAITVAAPAVAGTNTLTLPATTGTVIVNTTGGDETNTGFGNDALDAITTGSNNSAFGADALTSNTTANQNTAVGRYALRQTTTGSNNVATGYASLITNTTGYDNTAHGHNSLYSNTTGLSNTGIGKNALLTNTTGSQNTAVGSGALYTSTTNDNVAVGNYVLDASTTSDYNVGVGYVSLSSVTTGGRNTAVGRSSGSGLTTGSNGVFLGYNSRPSGASSDFATAIGYNVVGAAEYTTIGKSSSDIRAAHGVATWATVSDERYKKDIEHSTAGLDFVNDLKPRTFNYRNKGDLPTTFAAYKKDSDTPYKNSKTNHGFIAQEVKAAIDAHPDIKDGFRMWDSRDDGSQEVSEAAVIPILVKAIQELSAKVDELENKLQGN